MFNTIVNPTPLKRNSLLKRLFSSKWSTKSVLPQQYPDYIADVDAFYLGFSFIKQLADYHSAYYEFDGNDFTVTENDISFFEVPFHTNKLYLIKKLGRPSFKTHRIEDNLKVETFFYTKMFFGTHMVVQFHLINNSLQYAAGTLLDSGEKYFAIFKELLEKKYGQLGVAKNDQIFLFEDKKHNRVIFNNLFHPTLVYVSKQVADTIHHLIDVKQQYHQKMNHALISKWYKRV